MTFKTTLFLLALLATPTMAHQPVIVPEGGYPVNAPYEVELPEVSKAFFAKLDGLPHYYRIVSPSSFRFYAGITAPKIEGCSLQRFSFDVLDGSLNTIAVAKGDDFEWRPWYERFGKQWYWLGPEVGVNFKSDQVFAAGSYYIRVFNADNSGRYVLAIGDVESFPIDIIVKSMTMMPGLNRDFWSVCPGE